MGWWAGNSGRRRRCSLGVEFLLSQKPPVLLEGLQPHGGASPTTFREQTPSCTAWAELNVPRWMNTCRFWAFELLPHFLQTNRAAVDARVRVCVEALLLWNLWTVPGGLYICRSFQLPCVRAPVLMSSWPLRPAHAALPRGRHCFMTKEQLFWVNSD